MWRATIKGLLAKKLRLVLTALAVVLGVGFVAGTYVLTDTMNKTFDDIFKTASAGTDVVVRAKTSFGETAGEAGGGFNRNPVPELYLSLVRPVPGVKAAEGSLSGYAQFVDRKTGKAITTTGAPTFGVSWNGEAGALTLRDGSAPTNGSQVAMDAATAKKHGFRVGDQVKVLFQGPVRTFTISGIVGFGEADNLGGATMAAFDLKTAQEVFGRVGEFDEIDVVADQGVSAGTLRARIAATLPKGYEAVTGSTVAQENSDAIQSALGFFKTALLVFAFVALFVGAFIIFNTFSIIVAQRTRELALLRALGASRRQVLASVMVESLVIGLAASVVGLGVGVLIALGLQAMLKGFGVDLPSTKVQLLPRTVVVSIALGVLVTLVASVMPARRAARVAPVQALREGQPVPTGASLRRRIVTGLVVTGLGVAGVLYGLFGGPSSAGAVVGLGAAVTFVGAAMLSPLVARPLAGGIGWPLPRLGMSGKLGRENAMRSPRRTASTAAALMIGLGLVSFVSILAASLKSSASVALDETLKADFVLSTSSFQPFSPQVALNLQRQPELGAVTSFRQGQFHLDGSSGVVTAVDPLTVEQVATVDVLQGTIESLVLGDVLVHRDVAKAHGWKLGDRIPMDFAQSGMHRLAIGGIYGEDRLVGDYVVSMATYRQNFDEQLDSFVLVKAAPGVSTPQARGAIDRVLSSFPNVEVSNQAEFKQKQIDLVNRLLGLVTALLGLAVIIALFGIVNTLSLSIYERTRELGLLRAVGMTRRQVRSMIRWESVIIAVLGALLGIVIGVFFGWAMQRALADQGISELAIPAVQLAVYVALAGVAGVVAAVVPARRAARLNVLEAIAYE